MIGDSEDPRQIACVLPPEAFHSVWWEDVEPRVHSVPSTQGLTKQGLPWSPARAAWCWCSGVLGHCSCTSFLDSSTSV